MSFFQGQKRIENILLEAGQKTAEKIESGTNITLTANIINILLNHRLDEMSVDRNKRIDTKDKEISKIIWQFLWI